MKTTPMGMLLVMLTGWINRYQQNVIEYLKDENKVLREDLGGTRRTPPWLSPVIQPLFSRDLPRPGRAIF